MNRASNSSTIMAWKWAQFRHRLVIYIMSRNFVIVVVFSLMLAGCSQSVEQPVAPSPTSDIAATPPEAAKPSTATDPAIEAPIEQPSASLQGDPLGLDNWTIESQIKGRNDASKLSDFCEIKRKADGLYILTFDEFGHVAVKNKVRFQDNFEVNFEFRAWTDKDKEEAGVRQMREFFWPSLFISTEDGKATKGIPLISRNTKSTPVAVKVRCCSNKIEIRRGSDAPMILQRRDTSPVEFYIDVMQSAALVMTKFEVKENLPVDQSLASAQPTVQFQEKGAPGMLGGMGPPGMGPGPMGFGGMGPGGIGPGGMGPGGMGPGPMGLGGMGPGGLGGGNSNASMFMNFRLPSPTSSDDLLSFGKWFVPKQGNLQSNYIEDSLDVKENRGKYSITKRSSPEGFWLVRKLELEDGDAYECHVHLSSLQEMMKNAGFDPGTMMATYLFRWPKLANQQSDVQCPPIPNPLPNQPRDVTLKVTREGERVNFTVDGVEVASNAIGNEPLMIGLYLKGAVQFEIHDREPLSRGSGLAQSDRNANGQLDSDPGSNEIVFRRLGPVEKAVALALTEDGKNLVACYESTNVVRIFDVVTSELVKEIPVTSPRLALCRGNSIFVSSSSEQIIEVIAKGADWEKQTSLALPQPSVVLMSAPFDSAFHDEILLCCHIYDKPNSRMHLHNILLNVKTGEHREVAKHYFASFDVKGTHVIVQDDTRSNPSTVGIYPTEDFLSGGRLSDPIEFPNPEFKNLHVFAHNKTNYLISLYSIFESNPNACILKDLESILVPDFSRNYVYSLSENRVNAYTLSKKAKLVSSAEMRIELPENPKASPADYDRRTQEPVIAQPVAFAHGNKLFLFLVIPKTGELLRAETSAFMNAPNESSIAKDLASAENAQEGDANSGEQDSLADVIQRAEESVVRIETTSNSGNGIGSGFLIDSDGTFLTNYHVMAGATSATAHFADGQTAEITGTLIIDPEHDVVVAKLSKKGRPPLPIATSLPRKGDEVIALGTPYGLDFSATRGIVSAIRSADELPRDLSTEREGTWIQIDAPLSPGNSGGPLINKSGKVVAMSTLASNGAAQNLNFGISAENLTPIITLAKNQRVIPLTESTGKLKRMASSSGDNRSQAEFQDGVPDEAVEVYVDNCRQNFTKYLKELRAEITELTNTVKEMEKGEVALPPDTDSKILFLKAVTPQKQVMWFFRNSAVKRDIVDIMKSRQEELAKVRSKLKNNKDPESLKNLAVNYGPVLDSRKNHEIGFLGNATVLQAFNEHEVAIEIDGVACLVMMESTVGLSEGIPLLPCAVYVDGSVTIELAQGSTRAVTRLRQVNANHIGNIAKQMIEKTKPKTAADDSEPASNPADSFRTWSDTTGKYKIEAELVSNENDSVTLKRRDGTVVTLPIAKLSEADQEYLKSIEKP